MRFLRRTRAGPARSRLPSSMVNATWLALLFTTRHPLGLCRHLNELKYQHAPSRLHDLAHPSAGAYLRIHSLTGMMSAAASSPSPTPARAATRPDHWSRSHGQALQGRCVLAGSMRGNGMLSLAFSQSARCAARSRRRNAQQFPYREAAAGRPYSCSTAALSASASHL